MNTANGLGTRQSIHLHARSRSDSVGTCGSASVSSRPQVRPQARRHAELLGHPSVATTHQARTRVEPEQHRGISSHEQTEKVAEPFDWAHQWYSLGSAEDMDPSRPHAVTLLGRDLVLWRDQQGDWRAFEDVCPHRLAPLSEGRLEADGTLACSYHGWRFGPDGKCTMIPQATDQKAEQTACASSRSAATTFPVQVAEGLIWVWGSGGTAEHIHAAAKRPNVTQEADDLPEGQNLTEVFKMYTRDLPYDWQILVENFVDPSHVPFAHHGVQGNRYSEGAGDIQMEPTEGFTEGLSFDTQLRMFNPKKATMTRIQFFPPSLVRYFTEREEGFSTMNLMVTPLAPGRSRVTFRLLTNIDSKFIRLAQKMPKWLDHIKTRSLVFDGDNYFLHVQERVLAQEAAEGRSWKKRYFMPTVADRFVTAFRQWLDANGGSVGWAPGVPTALPPRETSREALLDRYNSHTKHCPSCMKALAVFKALRAAAVVAGVSMLLGLSSVLGRGTAAVSPTPIGLLAAAVASAVAWRLASDWVQKFYYVDYVHQEHH